MKKIENEIGRSMTEMLGTLAIIGVLSIGGIAGYSYGMDKYYTSVIVKDIMLRSVDVKAQLEQKREVEMSAWPVLTAGKYPISLENGTSGIQVSGVEKNYVK